MKYRTSFSLDGDVLERLRAKKRQFRADSESQFVNWILRRVLFTEKELVLAYAKEKTAEFNEAMRMLDDVKEDENSKARIQVAINQQTLI